MTNFNYEKAYFVQALPAFLGLPAKSFKAHSLLLPMVKDLNQKRDLNIPLIDEMLSILNDLTCQELAELSRASYFVGQWKPSHTLEVFENKSGESWKIANVCDQVLRLRFKPYFGLPRNIQIHEGVFRVTFSNKNCWFSGGFGLAIEKNLEIFKTCGLQFGEDTLEESTKQLAGMCGDLWPDVDTMPNNPAYEAFLIVKAKAYKLELKKRYADKLASIEKDIENSKIELAAFTWLIDNGIDEQYIENCIYYDHAGRFTFGWRKKLSNKEKDELSVLLLNFPYTYDLK
jgi:hypothetical protein